MLHLRRYRYFVVCAVVVVLLLYHASQSSDWEPSASPIFGKLSHGSNSRPSFDQSPIKAPPSPPPPKYHNEPHNEVPPSKDIKSVKIPDLKTSEEIPGRFSLPTSTEKPARPQETNLENPAETTKGLDAVIPDRKPGHVGDIYDQGRSTTSTSTEPTTTIHWSKQPEHFPVPPRSLITLPTGKPKAIPKVQFDFKTESAEAKEKRLGRLKQVKDEMIRAWGGYKKYAWMHDELSPVSKKNRDPFCGWAATLVDSLDTLWIMGMKEEFDEAVEATAKIDFTTSPFRDEIPVFETTIRYLGGFLGAYDVSGGNATNPKYNILVEKATELAEILMGVFDTPNRMPILYYNWNPAFASQPQRASQRVSVAELGSLLMEFTRLAQVTGQNKYYDAVARITDAFEELQNKEKGTTIPGIFPENLDASGCNRTASEEERQRMLKEAEARNPPPTKDTSFANTDDTSGVSAPGRSKDEYRKQLSSEANSNADFRAQQRTPGQNEEDHHSGSKKSGKRQTSDTMQVDSLHGPAVAFDSTMPLEDNCLVKQGLTSSSWGTDSYSMGGSQDSTYEYFPKQYVLLGGLEDKYRTMHLKVADAVKKWLLYRPMVPGDRDLLFSAKVSTQGDPENDLMSEFEVTHLTCFLGGMFGMAGRIFNEPVDVDIGAKLTDGCVWAYESMTSGIMPEAATIVPCASVTDCKWNETLWHQYLDPLWETRDMQVEEWDLIQQERKAKDEELAEEKRKLEKIKKAKQEAARLEREKEAGTGIPSEIRKDSAQADAHAHSDSPTKETERKPEYPGGLKKRSPLPPQVVESPGSKAMSQYSAGRHTDKPATHSSVDADVDLAATNVQNDLDFNTPTHIQEGPGQIPLAQMPDPSRPLTHAEFVKQRIDSEGIPPGFANINYRSYILRPEAIESVWYMYRITGDTTWQDKGWRMFQAVINATQTEIGHSAIHDVLVKNSTKDDAMESFWLAETLKYFYLLFTSPDVISLDDWVLNTEAHPLRRP